MNSEMLPQVRALLQQFSLRPRKRLGQHFLVDGDVLERILSAAEPEPEDIIIEVGPGLGILTRRLAEAVSRVIAVELDSRLVSMLKKELAAWPNVEIVHGDVLKTAPQQLIAGGSGFSGCAPSYKVVANLPYYITSPVLRHFLRASSRPSLMVVMVQKEVGEAIAAVPGKLSILAVGVQFYARPSIVAHVPADGFYPAPKVDSLILRLDVRHKVAVEVEDEDAFLDMVSCGFKSPRKQLRNSLSRALGIPAVQVAASLEKAGIEARRRAETLSMEEWRAVYWTFGRSRE